MTAAAAIADLPVPSHAAAVAVLPLGATSKRPVLVAAHGRDDLVEPLCETFGSVVQARGFVVCSCGDRSSVRPGAWTWRDEDALADELDAAFQALRARFPDHVDDGPLVFAGFSLGSFHGVDVVTRAPERTPRVVLIEGGHDPWNADRVSRFAERGGQRVLFVTGQAVNEARSRRAASELTEAGVGARVVHVEGAGHVYSGEVRDRMAEAFDWVVEGDERWRR